MALNIKDDLKIEILRNHLKDLLQIKLYMMRSQMELRLQDMKCEIYQ